METTTLNYDELTEIKRMFDEEKAKNAKGATRSSGSLVSRSFWDSEKMNDDTLTNQDRYFMLYLLTNTAQNMIGCFQIQYRKVTFDTHLSKTQISESLDRLKEVGAIELSGNRDEVLVYGWLIYSIGSGGATNVQRMLRDAAGVRDRILVKQLYHYYNDRFSRLSATARTFIMILGQRLEDGVI